MTKSFCNNPSARKGLAHTCPTQVSLEGQQARIAFLEGQCSDLQVICEILEAELGTFRQTPRVSQDALVKRINRRLARETPPFVLRKRVKGDYFLTTYSEGRGWCICDDEVNLYDLAKELGVSHGA